MAVFPQNSQNTHLKSAPSMWILVLDCINVAVDFAVDAVSTLFFRTTAM